MKTKTKIILGVTAGALVLSYWHFTKWKGTGASSKAGTFFGWLLNRIGLKKDSGYN